MPAFYKIDKERRLVLSSGAGTFTLADALGHQEKLAGDPDFDPSFSQLMDFSHITGFDIDADGVRRLAQRSIFSPHSRRAIIMKSEAAYGLARMFEILREAAGEHGIHVFRNLDEALDWILSKEERV
jgi:hypothetical protein